MFRIGVGFVGCCDLVAIVTFWMSLLIVYACLICVLVGLGVCLWCFVV